jgi:fanconi anemia group J protein
MLDSLHCSLDQHREPEPAKPESKAEEEYQATEVTEVTEVEEEEEEEEFEENKNDDNEKGKQKKQFKGERSIRFLFRDATKAKQLFMEGQERHGDWEEDFAEDLKGGVRAARDVGPGPGVELKYEEDKFIDAEGDFWVERQRNEVGSEKAAAATRENKRAREEFVLAKCKRADLSNSFTMLGIPVAFPVGLTPLVPQKIVMSKVIQALQKSQHALIESPTGTGKSLALLCAALAFQKDLRRRNFEIAVKRGQTPENQKLPLQWRAANGMFVDENVKKEEVTVDADADVNMERLRREDKEDDNDLMNNDSEEKKPSSNQSTATTMTPMADLPDGWRQRMDGSAEEEQEEQGEPEIEIPKIFLCSRTHSQINQLARELKRCPYRPRFSVLGSRQQFCPAKKTDEECQELTKGSIKAVPPHGTKSKCSYFNRQGYLLEEMQHAQIWDIEDLKHAAEEHEGCTFYVTKELAKTAEFILCPYNYIFDVSIRNAMSIDLRGAAIIIDEGHNIEDVCRDGASIEIFEKDLDKNVMDIQVLASNFPEAVPVKNFLNSILSWLSRKMKQREKFDRYKHTRTITDAEVIVEEFYDALCDPKTNETLDSVLNRIQILTSKESALMTRLKESSEGKTGGSLGMQALRLAGEISAKIILFKHYSNDFVLCIARFAHDAFSNMDKPKQDEKQGGFALWCLRPAVAFEAVAKKARCVILTSGTLSPTSSLEGELGVPFPIKVDAPHVVPSNQIFVESLNTMGAVTKKNLDATPEFPTKLFDMLFRYCKRIPGGVLVFLPSYDLIGKIEEDWHRNDHFQKMAKIKRVVYETSGSRGFEETLDNFKEGLAHNGSLLFAVYRGKCSEGLDFKDDTARAVFCVGIPFPNLGDVKVQLKKQFNSSAHGRQKSLLEGGQWYAHQAFRAYNQALGRVVRHLHDYAAIFLVDQRFCHEQEYTQLISKWIRGRVTTPTDQNNSVGMLTEFFEHLTANPPGPAPKIKAATKKIDAVPGVVPDRSSARIIEMLQGGL